MPIHDSRPRWLLLAVLLPCLCLAGCAARTSRSPAADRAVADSPTPVPTFTPVPTSSPTFTPTSTPTPTLLPTPTPSLTQTGTFDFPAVHTDSRYELQLTGTRVLAVFATSGSPVEYWARAVWLPLFTVPEPFRPPNPIFRMVEGQPVHADGTPDTARTAPHYVLLRVDPDGTVHYVDDARVEGAGRLAYALHMAWVTAPVAVESVPSEVPEPAPSLTVSGTYNNLVEHEDGRYELQLAGTRVVANLFTSRSPVQYRAREVATPLFTVPVPFRPPYPILRTAEGIPVRNDSTLASDLPELRRFLLRVDTDGSVHYVDDTRVEGKDRQAYCLNLVGLTGPGHATGILTPSAGIAAGPLRAPAGAPQPPPPSRCADAPGQAGRFQAYRLDTVWGTTPAANDRAVLEILDRHWFGETLLSAEPPPVQFEVPEHSEHMRGTFPAARVGAFVTFDADGRVTALGAPYNEPKTAVGAPVYNFNGPLLPELGQLHHLEHLDLGYRTRVERDAKHRAVGWGGPDSLTGAIPPQLWRLPRLRHLDLQGQLLAWTLPSDIGRLASLEYLDLGHNWLSGPLPPELGRLASLKYLDLGGNDFTEPLPPEWGQLDSLEILELSGNQLTGLLPPAWDQLDNLRKLALYRNQLTGSLPPEWGQLANLRRLDLYDNQLTGPLPPEWGQMTSLRELALSYNQLSGPLPPEWGQLANLQRLFLSGNQLTGPLPPEWGQLDSLEWLHLKHNQLTGCYSPNYFPGTDSPLGSLSIDLPHCPTLD